MLLDHVNLRCRSPEAMADFLEALNIVSRGARPAFDNHGFWMVDDSGRPVVHLSTRDSDASDDGVVDHVAFSTDDAEALRATLARRGLLYTERENPLAGVRQFKFSAPEGIVIEIQAPLKDV